MNGENIVNNFITVLYSIVSAYITINECLNVNINLFKYIYVLGVDFLISAH